MDIQKTASQIGEFGLIERIQKILGKAQNNKIILGIGDDTAVIDISGGKVQLLTCDIQIEGQHFQRDFLSPYQLGRRAMAVNLSDIAAMGGTPTFALVSLGVPPDFPVSDFEDLFRGFRDQLNEFGATVIGGNLARSDSGLIIDITMLGESKRDIFLTRSGASPGDRIFVSNFLGMAGAGVAILRHFGDKFPQKYEKFVNAYRQPSPRIHLGQRLAESGLVTAMMDISDGLAGDLNHICEQSHCGAVVLQEKLPFDPDLAELKNITKKTSEEMALFGGEDYELLLTVNRDADIEKLGLIAKETGVRMHEIGYLTTEEKGLVLQNSAGNTRPLAAKGWDHFSLNET
ncbi:thiamine-phosphate kinase [candidate division KSB1 bacterium 4484_87]|nr:MAG: thiamine-phosphate kinase [candidate division KSB1 bacterium 4484_87]